MLSSLNNSWSKLLARRVGAALGRIPFDRVLKRVWVFDAFQSRFADGAIGIIDGVIAAVEWGSAGDALRGTREYDGRGRHWVVPGFIDAHVHLESSMLLPRAFAPAVMAKGTTSAVCDPHELANVAGVRGIEYFLESAKALGESFDLFTMLSSCVPATHLETNGGGSLSWASLAPLAAHPYALGLAEMMNFPGVVQHDPSVMEKITGAHAHGFRIDGHAPLVRGRELSAYAATGISSCHESSELAEATEKLSKGLSVWIREGSVAKDLRALLPLLDVARSVSVGFCTDDRNPLDIAEEGHLDHLVREAIRAGIAPEVAFRASSFSVARHYGLDRRFHGRLGAIAPGFQADLVVLSDVATVEIAQVYKRGAPLEEAESARSFPDESSFRDSVRCTLPDAAALEGVHGSVHVIEVLEGKIVTGRSVRAHDARGVHGLSVLERHGKGGAPANAYVHGFGENLNGAIASSVGHDSHNLIAVGSTARDRAVAFAALKEMGGGFVVVQGGEVRAKLALAYGGLMSAESPSTLARGLGELRAASREIGGVLHEPFLQLAFLSLPVIPTLKLTDKGLVDVEKFEVIPVSA